MATEQQHRCRTDSAELRYQLLIAIKPSRPLIIITLDLPEPFNDVTP